MMNVEPGGKDFAKGVILAFLSTTGGSNAKLLSTATGLPRNLINQLLYELEDQNRVKVGLKGRIWHINEEAML